MEYVATKQGGAAVRFVDKKKWHWLWGFALPVITIASFAYYGFVDRQPALLTVPFVAFFIVIPLLDALLGGDTENPPESAVPAMIKDRFYEKVAYCLIPAYFLQFVATIWLVATQNIPLWATLMIVVSVGSINGNMINVGHELGHKTDKRNRFFTKLALSLSGYGHFTIEHNRGHHKNVATPEDCASARFGENVYQFALRELPGAMIGGWREEKTRLEKSGLPFFHWKNDILQVYTLTLLFTAMLVAWFGWAVAPFIIVHHFFSWYGLTQVNYIEHYGLLRQKRENGRYEPCAPRHSWNSNHRVSNILSLHLQRHSDHHANPMRPYQALRDYDDVPCLPSGYPGCLVLSAIPPLWFKIMDPRVLDWADGDHSKINHGVITPATTTTAAA